MKLTPILCAGVLVSAVLASSCSKKNNDDVPAGPSSSDSAHVTYKVMASNADSGLIRFTTVQGAGKQVAFKGNSTSRVEVYKYNFQPSNFLATGGYELTTVAIQPGTYQNAEFNYQLIPSRDPALRLTGTWSGSGTSVPVEVNIDQFVEIATKTPSVTLEAGKTYTALLNLDLKQLQAGIFPGDLTSATRTNGKIVIAYYSNPSLLQEFINNINNVMQHQVTFTAQ
ncbi:hypothetical protein [Flaviaesturariibacter aridisoli]|uniref:DUF4397 domain-containing protein n=1 Tax=Flaviaesturariibacter aridisoli TaxID=2545761 RepID=A0A4R4DWW4_9BACT|nr:hypothetical protein [Flaviaesturariibacter aridisoli]TCZ69053.1 hypothetical protein E0486_12785 [Flaviaesturariibacter aridisoli]